MKQFKLEYGMVRVTGTAVSVEFFEAAVRIARGIFASFGAEKEIKNAA
jgi:hypothetical protein